MEGTDNKTNLDEKTLGMIADFNSITQNQDQRIAQHYLEMSAYDLNKAISLYLENPPNPLNNPSTQSTPSVNREFQPNPDPTALSNAIFQQLAGMPFFTQNNELNQKVAEYKLYLREKEKKDAEFELNVISSIYKTSTNAIKGVWNKIMPIAIRGETPGGEEFTCFLHKNMGKIKSFNFLHGNLGENIDYAFSKNRMLLVFIYSMDNALQSYQRNLLKHEPLIKYTSDNFMVLGLLQNKNETLALQQKYPNIQEIPCFIVFRKNIYEKPEIMEIIPITEAKELDSYIEKLKEIKIAYNKKTQEEDNIKAKAIKEVTIENQSRYFGYAGNNFFNFNDEYYGGNSDYNYQRPQVNRAIDPIAQRKLENDRMLIKQQEEEYKMAQRKAEEQQLKKAKELEEQKHLETLKRQEEEEKINIEKQKQYELLQKKAKLPLEPSASEADLLEVLFRLPNGSKITRRFRKSEKIENMYIYIETLEGVTFKTTTQFDIIRTMPPMNLSDKKEKMIGEVFDESQELFHIREID